MTGEELILELTQEQGPGRETQVQPPVDVWIRYFAVDLEVASVLTLENHRDSSYGPEERPIVEHDHNWTMEVAGAALPRPAIMRLSRRGNDTYAYWVYRPGDAEYSHCQWMLDTFTNPYWRRGRGWLIV